VSLDVGVVVGPAVGLVGAAGSCADEQLRRVGVGVRHLLVGA